LIAALDLVTLLQIRHWPLQGGEIASSVKNIILPLGNKVKSLIGDELILTLEHLLMLAFVCLVLLTMLTMSMLLRIEQRQPVCPPVDMDDDKDEVSCSAFGNFDTVANLGRLGASRIDLYTKSRTIDSMLERWQVMHPEPFQIQSHLSDCLPMEQFWSYWLHFCCFCTMCLAWHQPWCLLSCFKSIPAWIL
jgi:hypothetical protein